jgi:hypothetical protein
VWVCAATPNNTNQGTNKQMEKMYGEMMKHMMEHMQMGKESMSKCPMMKGMKDMKTMDMNPQEVNKEQK